MLFGPEVIVDKVIRGDLVQTIVASGHIETPYRVEIGSQITGTVNEVLVEEGQHVDKGVPLIALEASEFKATMVEAQGCCCTGRGPAPSTARTDAACCT